FGYGVAMRKSEARQRQAAVVDSLTGLLNRSKLSDRFEEVRQLAVARHESVALLVCDLDHFKAVNDEHGHAAGDRVLVDTAMLLRAALAGHELIYRLGGEEFVVIIAGADAASAASNAERVRAAIATGRPGGVDVTISVGTAVAAGADLHYDALFGAADAALYDAKHRGRDQAVTVVLAAGAVTEVDEHGGRLEQLRAA
ncbi:MAG: GGDEF domain-containing protein, partial [Solirubrobacteraceae bacterium]|nr:GGDEF domain-containing protein [Solirubrobacteraceae bacterium]